MVISWIVHSVSTAIILSIHTTEDIWLDLKTLYSQEDLLHIFYVQLEASSIK